MKINWEVRIKNKAFWIAIIPAAFLLIQQVLALFGITWDFTELTNRLIAIVGTVFAIGGIIIDPTTEGVSDSNRAMQYAKPKGD